MGLRQLILDPKIATSTALRLLDESCLKGKANAVTFLLETFPDLEPDCYTAYLATYAGLKVYRIIHTRTPNILDTNFDHYGDAIHSAVRRSDVVLLEYLLKNGADPGREPSIETPRFAHRFIPIESAVLSSTPIVAQLLIDYGAKVQQTTALETAASLGRIDMMSCLIEAGANINGVFDDVDGLYGCACNFGTALHSAARSDQVEATRYLVEHGARLDMLDNSGLTAMEIASNHGHTEVMRVLQTTWTEPSRGVTAF